jgi:hypothetical protein
MGRSVSGRQGDPAHCARCTGRRRHGASGEGGDGGLVLVPRRPRYAGPPSLVRPIGSRIFGGLIGSLRNGI